MACTTIQLQYQEMTGFSLDSIAQHPGYPVVLESGSCWASSDSTAILILAESWVMDGAGEGGPGKRDRRCQGDSVELQGCIHGVSGLPGVPSPGMRHDYPALPRGGETK